MPILTYRSLLVWRNVHRSLGVQIWAVNKTLSLSKHITVHGLFREYWYKRKLWTFGNQGFPPMFCQFRSLSQTWLTASLRLRSSFPSLPPLPPDHLTIVMWHTHQTCLKHFQSFPVLSYTQTFDRFINRIRVWFLNQSPLVRDPAFTNVLFTIWVGW